MALTVVLKGGTLRVASPELVEPFAAGTLDGSVDDRARQADRAVGDPRRRGTVARDPLDDRPRSRRLPATRACPSSARTGRSTSGKPASRPRAGSRGLWRRSGTGALVDQGRRRRCVGVEAAGPTLAGRPTEARPGGRGLRRRAVGDRLDDPQARPDQPGRLAPGERDRSRPIDGTPAQLRGRVDLAALAKMLPNAMRLRDGLALDRGTASLRVDLTTAGGRRPARAGRPSLDDFAATEAGRAVTLRQPVRLTGKAVRTPEKVAVEALEVKAAGVDVTAGGDLEAGVKLSGTVRPRRPDGPAPRRPRPRRLRPLGPRPARGRLPACRRFVQGALRRRLQGPEGRRRDRRADRPRPRPARRLGRRPEPARRHSRPTGRRPGSTSRRATSSSTCIATSTGRRRRPGRRARDGRGLARPRPARGEGEVPHGRDSSSRSTSFGPGSRRATRRPPRGWSPWRSGGGSTWPRAKGTSGRSRARPSAPSASVPEGAKLSAWAGPTRR